MTVSLGVRAETVNVYAASSMTNAVEALGQTFAEQTGFKVVNVFAGSSAMARQIAHGAPADVFISANQQWVDYLVSQSEVSDLGVTPDRVYPLVSNQLVLITNNRNPPLTDFDLTSPESWQRLLANQRIALGNVSSVPVGLYSQQALQALGVWQTIQPRTAQMNNVRQVLALVERNEVPVAIVYYTDAIASKKVRIIKSISPDSHAEIVYPMAMIKETNASRRYREFVLSQQGQNILFDFGFQPISGSHDPNR
ncbi:molybdate ABC transporter substrate-binding protein [Vibrio hippocampi]|uniref:molybdate ABC transporter substrate-binding protein n=1 Tax=Vibrio hippocampi TaxID=654686 RepID=UPI001F022F95|nr:molybdate ABC transporter substrate-binding protein [Vibrio hippocampi]